jgi:hypothetical protein
MNERCWKPDIWVKYQTENFRSTIFGYLGWIYSKDLGKKLIDEILAYTSQWHHNKLCIVESTLPSHYRDDRREILYNLAYRVSEPTYDRLASANALPVYFYHELVHAYRSGKGEYETATAGETVAGIIKLEEEYPTTGLFEYADYPFSENAFRKQLRLPRRPCYPTENAANLEEEKRRRYFLMLPRPGLYNQYEFRSNPENRFTQKMNKHHFDMYVARQYNNEKRDLPNGFEPNLDPIRAIRQNGYGPRVGPPTGATR